MIEEIKFDNKNYAIVIRSSFRKEGITFVTEPSNSQQLAQMQHPKGKIIEPHFHNRVERKITDTQEVLLIKEGVLKVDFYTNKLLVGTRNLYKGDLILLIDGGHGFSVLEDLIMIEIKQGPYLGDKDKERFISKSN